MKAGDRVIYRPAEGDIVTTPSLIDRVGTVSHSNDLIQLVEVLWDEWHPVYKILRRNLQPLPNPGHSSHDGWKPR